MKSISLALFYGYIGLVCLAGFWGAFINPEFDHRWLFHMDIYALKDYERINMLSQYRFLRALELGFGIISMSYVKQIFSEPKLNRLFTITMGAGILARLTSIFFDGRPSTLMILFLGYELIAWLVLLLYSIRHIYSSKQMA
jgi:hypothetical protein